MRLEDGHILVVDGETFTRDSRVTSTISRHRHTWSLRHVMGCNAVTRVQDPSVSQSVFTISEKAPSRAFSWLKLLALSHLRHYAKQGSTSL